MNRYRLYRFLFVLILGGFFVCSCGKGGVDIPKDGKCISFGVTVPQLASRVTVSDDKNIEGKFDVTFDEGDSIGVYLYYNNYFNYYNEYSTHAESVIFANELLTVADGGMGANYNRLKSWTFSTLYGTKPFKYDAIAYYPFTTNYDPEYNIASKWSDAASNIFVYQYNPTKFANHCDVMIGSATYTGTNQDPVNFRDEILGGKDKINLKFSRRLASVNIGISKADELQGTSIVLTGLTVYFDYNNRFVYDQSTGSGDWQFIATDGSEQSTMGSGSVYVAPNFFDNNVKTLEITSLSASSDNEDNLNPTPDGTLDSGIRLSADLLTKHLYFPPKTEILKFVFDITVDGVVDQYTWHPHVSEIKANTHYLLNLELYPGRLN